MSAKNSIKQYVENGYYHIYNRGVEKRKIFEDEQDYAVFLSYLKTYLTLKDLILLQRQLAESTTALEHAKVLREINLNNFFNEISLLAYCLMPNHFHMLIKQSTFNTIDNFINSLNTRYVMYFNRKNNRIGPLFQGVYKAVLVETDEQLLHLSAYIHRNPAKLLHKSKRKNLQLLLQQPSSLSDYIGITNTSWVNTKIIQSFFTKTKSKITYEHLIFDNSQQSSSIANITID